MSYFDRLREAARSRSSQLCVGLDPEPDLIPGGATGAFEHCLGVVRQTSAFTCCYKPNSAFWEQYGPDGWRALLELRAAVPGDIPVLLDAKRADIGSTMRAYARAIFENLGMDAVTVHAYHGRDSLLEFTRYQDRGVYVVCRTSNPGAADLQHLAAPERPLYLEVAALAERVNANGNVGLVVGATAPEQVAEIRSQTSLPFLVPGVGVQGGDLAGSVRAAWNGDPASCLVSTSRAVLYAPDPGAAADELRQAINRVLEGLATTAS
jgi:orotidine 5'-phosphate decarboxylase subfamily 2